MNGKSIVVLQLKTTTSRWLMSMQCMEKRECNWSEVVRRERMTNIFLKVSPANAGQW
jgi:hypothetical protein